MCLRGWFVCQSTPRWGWGYPSQVWMVGGVPQPGLDGGGGTPVRSGWYGGYPSQVWMVRYPARSWWWGVPQPGLDGWEVPQPGLDGGGYPSQVWMVGGTWSTLPSQVWMVGGVPSVPPWPGLDGARVPRVPPSPWLDGYSPHPPPHHDWMGYPPPPHQHSKHLLRSRRYASCVHAGGLSCILFTIYFHNWQPFEAQIFITVTVLECPITNYCDSAVLQLNLCPGLHGPNTEVDSPKWPFTVTLANHVEVLHSTQLCSETVTQ